MDFKTVTEKYKRRLVTEAVLKAAVTGALTGLAAGAVFAAFLLIFRLLPAPPAFFMRILYSGWQIPLFTLCVSVAASLPFYRFVFRPTERDVAKRLDALGLRERSITMLDMAEETGYMAQRQREDAQSALGTVSPSRLRVSVSKFQVTVAAVLLLLLLFLLLLPGMTEAFALPPLPPLPPPSDTALQPPPPPTPPEPPKKPDEGANPPPQEEIPPPQAPDDEPEPVEEEPPEISEEPELPDLSAPGMNIFNFVFKDGQTPYSNEYEEYLKEETARLADSPLSDLQKEMVARYYASLRLQAEHE